MKYRLNISILSLAPQLKSSCFKVGKKTLKAEFSKIKKKDIKKCIKTIFPILSLVRFTNIIIEDKDFRQNISVDLTSFRKINKNLTIEGLDKSFYNLEISELDAQ